ncbi:imm11 family protein [Aquimarina sp. AU58]|uniref:imm11 family protein n=1 Tax=Aquimarina sp. AU58 TaxID=1874112 RepID=UPI00135A7EDF|nr:DUF1629 domain-containing protein [Aquimarina sp. AU58]
MNKSTVEGKSFTITETNNFNDEYYVCKVYSDEQQIALMPTDGTAQRNYSYNKLVLGQKPLFFTNAFREEDKNSRVLIPLTDVMFDSSSFIITTKLKDELSEFDTLNLQYYPAVYIGDDGKWHENYWYLNFYGMIDCLDKELSVLDEIEGMDELDEEDRYLEVLKYSLDIQVLEKIEEDNRLIFQIAGTSIRQVFMHKKIVDIFKNINASGIKFTKVSEYED